MLLEERIDYKQRIGKPDISTTLRLAKWYADVAASLQTVYIQVPNFTNIDLQTTWRRNLWSYFVSVYLNRRTGKRACLVVEIDSSIRPRDVKHTPRSTCQRNSSLEAT